jgi:hypothetical protein
MGATMKTMTTYPSEGYLSDATDFTEMVKKGLPSVRFPGMADYTVECPKCHGYGGWNLRLNAYPGTCSCEHEWHQHTRHASGAQKCKYPGCGCADFESTRTPEQRHFRAFCFQCHGWGWVQPGLDADCLHEFKEIAPDQPWRCWHTYKCEKCGKTKSVDSSD